MGCSRQKPQPLRSRRHSAKHSAAPMRVSGITCPRVQQAKASVREPQTHPDGLMAHPQRHMCSCCHCARHSAEPKRVGKGSCDRRTLCWLSKGSCDRRTPCWFSKGSCDRRTPCWFTKVSSRERRTALSCLHPAQRQGAVMRPLFAVVSTSNAQQAPQRGWCCLVGGDHQHVLPIMIPHMAMF